MTARQQWAKAEREARDLSLELRFMAQIKAAGLERGCWRQYRAVPDRGYAWDFAWPDERLLLEIQGGTWIQGAHSRGTGIRRDCEKLCAATLAGWRVMAIDTTMVRDGTGLKLIETALKGDKNG